MEALGPSQELAAPLFPWLSGEHSGGPFSSDAWCPDLLKTSALVGEVKETRGIIQSYRLKQPRPGRGADLPKVRTLASQVQTRTQAVSKASSIFLGCTAPTAPEPG